MAGLGGHIRDAVRGELREYRRNAELRDMRRGLIRARMTSPGGEDAGPVQGGSGETIGDRYVEALERDDFLRWLELKTSMVERALRYVRDGRMTPDGLQAGVILDQYLLAPGATVDHICTSLGISQRTFFRRVQGIEESVAPFLFGPFGQWVED